MRPLTQLAGQRDKLPQARPQSPSQEPSPHRPGEESIEEVDLPQELSDKDEMTDSSKDMEEPATRSTGEKEEDTPGRTNLNVCSCHKSKQCACGARRPPTEQYGRPRSSMAAAEYTNPRPRRSPQPAFWPAGPAHLGSSPSHPPTMEEEQVNSHLAQWTDSVHEACL